MQTQTDPFLEEVLSQVKKAPQAVEVNDKKKSKMNDLLKEVAKDLKLSETLPSKTISLRMPIDIHDKILATMGNLGERSMSRFILTVLKKALD